MDKDMDNNGYNDPFGFLKRVEELRKLDNLKQIPRTKKNLTHAIEFSHGIDRIAAKMIGMPLKQFRQKISTDPEMIEALEDAKKAIVDEAEARLANAVQNDEAWAIKFLLQKKGADRGYGDKLAITGNDGGPLIAGLANIPDDVLRKIAQG